jgi:hypothetical protein
MPSPLKHRAVALVGAVGMIPIALGLINQSLTVPAAAVRAVVLLVVLMVLEAVAVPVVRSVLADPEPSRRRGDDEKADAAS